MDENLEQWLEERSIHNVRELQAWLVMSFSGSLTNHNVRDTYIDLNSSQFSKMSEYFRQSIDDNDKYPAETIKYQQEQFEHWTKDHYYYDDDKEDD